MDRPEHFGGGRTNEDRVRKFPETFLVLFLFTVDRRVLTTWS